MAALTMPQAAAGFLAHRRIAVTGASREPGGKHGGNIVFQRLRERGYDVVPVNPNAEEVEGVRCYPDLASVPGGVEAVVIATRPEAAGGTIRECAELGIEDVWLHRSFGTGSVSPEAAAEGRARGLRVIEGGCPLMYAPTDDGGHRFLCRILTWTGKVPRTV
jgi:uncharacterized protein